MNYSKIPQNIEHHVSDIYCTTEAMDHPISLTNNIRRQNRSKITTYLFKKSVLKNPNLFHFYSTTVSSVDRKPGGEPLPRVGGLSKINTTSLNVETTDIFDKY